MGKIKNAHNSNDNDNNDIKNKYNNDTKSEYNNGIKDKYNNDINNQYSNDTIKDNEITDDGLKGNELIENAIKALQSEPSEEMLAHALTVIRRRMNDNGQLIIAVEPPMPGKENQGMKLKSVKTADGKLWWSAFTSFDEEVKGSDGIMSTFMTDIRKLFDSVLKVDEIEGVILNPWNRTIMLDKNLIKIIIGA